MALKYKSRLLAHLGHDTYTPAPPEQVARDLRIPTDDFPEFMAAVKSLAAAGDIEYSKDHSITLPKMGDEVVGVLRKNQKGFGFIQPLKPTAHGDLFVPPEAMLDALSGDTVKAKVVRSRRGDDGRSPFTGVIVEVIERRRTTFTGELRKQGNLWLVHPDGKVLTKPVVIRDATSKNAREGDKVSFELTTHPEGDQLGEGVITKVLGEAGSPGVETAGVIEAFNLPGEFPEACVEQARRAATKFDAEIKDADSGSPPKGFDPDVRLDLRNEYIITIDPPDAKDYDDAISIERIEADHPENRTGRLLWRLGVHIADVAHFIEPDSPLDVEARDRANSVYLPRLVIPMLPENLSNGICSLQEGVPRYCKTAWMDYDDHGAVRAEGYSQTIIKSAKRLTYIEAQALIDGDEEKAKQHARTEPVYTQRLKDTLQMMNHLSRRIRDRRRRAGMIHLELPEVELVFDEQTGKVVDARPEDDSYTHTLIEMFMVEANEAVARLFAKLNVPALRRIHPEPIPGAFDNLSEVVKVAGFRIPKNPTREQLQALLDATKGTAAAPAVHMAVLRTMTRAEYSPADVGHFALASDAYSHFTSPIRRYPDLTAHRSLAEYLTRTKNGRARPKWDDDKAWAALGKAMRESPMCPPEHDLILIGQNCNYREENAQEAERELRQFLVLQLMEEKIGESFPALVTGVTGAGVFVRLDKFLAEGLIKTEDLPVPSGGASAGGFGGKRAIWQVDRKSGTMIERNSGRSFSMGDRLEVTIVAVDLQRRQMELTVTDPERRAAGKTKKLASALRFGELEDEREGGLGSTGADRRAARSKSRDRNKQDFRQDRKNKGKW
ncbi:MAG: VacB/RNase II family 3'-5' exoribonuclease [Planctomycetes bacterium]|nr:VacB/RNase II family 3'-5' exoribonuclease [Planctomycetota bacterium]